MIFTPIQNLNELLEINDEAELYSRVSHQFRRLNAKFWDKANHQLMQHLPLCRPGHLLDLACGTGGFVIELAKKHPQMEITGIDFHPEMIQQARRDAWEAGAKNIQFIEKNLLHYLPEFHEGDFEIGTCMFALSYLGVEFILKELRRILGPEDRIGITTSSFNSLTDWQPLLFEFLRENQGKLNFSRLPSVPEQPTDAPDLKRRMEIAGFDKASAEAIQVPLSFHSVEEAACFLISSTWISNQVYSLKDLKMHRFVIDWAMEKIAALYSPGAPITTSIEFLVGWK